MARLTKYIFCVLAVAGASQSLLQAEYIAVTNGGPSGQSGIASDDGIALGSSGNFGAVAFEVGPTAINLSSVQFYGHYARNNVQPDDFTVAFRYVTDAGVPGDAVINTTGSPNDLTFDVTPSSKVDTGLTAAGLNVFDYTAPLLGGGVLVPNSVYIISIYNNTPGVPTDPWYWDESVDPGRFYRNTDTSQTFWQRSSQERQLAFTLYGVELPSTPGLVVPEPGSLAMAMTAAIGGLAFVRRKRS